MVATVFFAGAANASPESDLIGVWISTGKTKEQIEFFEDGTLLLVQKQSLGGRWKVLSDGRIKVEMSMLGVTTFSFAKVDGDRLRMDLENKTYNYVRQGSDEERRLSANLTTNPISEPKESTPESVVATLFAAARSGDFAQLSKLCPPTGENDGDTRDVCSLGDAGAENRPPARLSPKDFVATFKDGKIVGTARVNGSDAEVDILFGEGGKQRPETVRLINRNGNWYLYSF